MKIELKINEKPTLKRAKMLCDFKLDEKLDNYELTKFLNCQSTNLMVGKPKSGKTSLLYSFFKSKKLLNKVYENIYLFQPKHSRASMEDNIFCEIPEEQQFEELTGENIKIVNDMIENEASMNYSSCILIDDMTVYLKDPEVIKGLKKLIFDRRHLRCSIFFCCQTYKSVEKNIRKMFSNLFVFRCSKQELEEIFEELVESHKKIVMDIAKLVYDKPHQFLFINTDEQRLFRGFDEIIISS